ncbi:MAG: hypothetical protein IKI94_13145 [Ruminococcus sp.]|nr:hypothetical protein [Ruminococcus sp.]
MLNLNLETAKFIKNADNTYTVYQPIGKDSVLKLPRVVIDIKAEALVDESVGDLWQVIEREKPSKISKILNKIKACLRIRR